MELFGSSDSEDDGGAPPARPPACGPLSFHSGTEAELVRAVEASGARDPAAVLAAIDEFCWTRHWMMHVGDVKGAVLAAAARRAVAAARGRPLLAVEVGAYCGYSAVVVGRELRPGDALLSLEVEPACVGFARRVVALAGLTASVTVALAGADEAASAALARLGAAAPVDLLFLDHAKDRYLASLEDLEPRLRPGAVVVADNVLAVDGGASLAPYLARVRSPAYAESALHEAPLEYADGGERDGVEVSIFR